MPDIQDSLHDAIRQGDLAGVKRAIAHGATLIPDEYDETPLMQAALFGRSEIVLYLVHEEGQQINARSKTGANALVRAAISGNMDTIRWLVEHGADLNVVEEPYMGYGRGFSVMTGWESHHGTAIMAAIAKGFDDAVRFLADAGADLTARDSRGYDAFAQAVRYNRISMILFLQEKIGLSDTEGLFVAACLNLNALKWYVDTKKADINAQDSDGNTPLLRALRDGEYQFLESGPHPGNVPWKRLVAEYLLDRGADVNHRNSRGQTALMMVAECADKGCTELLLSRGANPLLADFEGRRASGCVVFPEEPPESSENSHEAWLWESVSLEDFRDYLFDAEKKA